MLHGLRPIIPLILTLTLGLIGCAENIGQPGTRTPAVISLSEQAAPATPAETAPAESSPSPPSSGTATLAPSAVVAEVTPQIRPTRTPSALPTGSPQPSPTVTLSPTVPPQPSPTVTLSPTAPPQPSPTVTLSPTVPPQPSPTVTPLPAAVPTREFNDPAAVRVELRPITGGLQTPVGIANAGDGSGRLFILEKAGRIRILRDGTLAEASFLDITDRVGSEASEQGLLGLAFHPDYVNSGFFFLNYTDRQGNTVVARYSVGGHPDSGDPASETVILRLQQPAANHNGGHLAFGPDSHLYVGTGDGGAANDRFGNGQNGGTLLGAMLRLDVGGAQPYTVPADNPFTGDADVRDEIWAIGLRNPWRYSFDRLTGDLYIADVGQNLYEEVNHQQAQSAGGQNYGWPIMEATHCFPEDQPCDQGGLTLPVAEYDHGQGCSVTGGYVYRGQEFPALEGIYLFGDFCSGMLWGMAASPGGRWRVAELGHVDLLLSSFGEDEAGELYLLDMGRGELHQVTASPR